MINTECPLGIVLVGYDHAGFSLLPTVVRKDKFTTCITCSTFTVVYVNAIFKFVIGKNCLTKTINHVMSFLTVKVMFF